MAALEKNVIALEIVAPVVPASELIVLAAAKALVINSPESARLAGELRKETRDGKRRVEALYDPSLKSLNDAKATVLEAKNRDVGPFDEALTLINGKIIAWDDKQEADRKAAIEAQRVQQAKLDAEHAEKLRVEREAREAEAAALAEAGRAEEAAAVVAAPTEVAPPPVATPVALPPAASIGKGGTIPKKWKAKVVNLPAFVAWCISSGNCETFLEAALPQLNAWATRVKNAQHAPPGIEFYSEKHVAQR